MLKGLAELSVLQLFFLFYYYAETMIQNLLTSINFGWEELIILVLFEIRRQVSPMLNLSNLCSKRNMDGNFKTHKAKALMLLNRSFTTDLIWTRISLMSPSNFLPLIRHQNQGDINQITRALFYNKQKEPFQTADEALIYVFIHFPFLFLSTTYPVGCF